MQQSSSTGNVEVVVPEATGGSACGPSTRGSVDAGGCDAASMTTLLHEALMGSLFEPNTRYLKAFRATQDATLGDLQCIARTLGDAQDDMATVEATFSKLPAYIAKLQTMQRNLVTLRDNAKKTKQIAQGLATQLLGADPKANGAKET